MVPLHRTAPLPDFWSVDIESGTNASFSKKISGEGVLSKRERHEVQRRI
jgi:hypothetical protein